MEKIAKVLEDKDWESIGKELHDNGFVIVRNILTEKQCDELIADYDADDVYRKTINMARYRFGEGEYKYFQYPLPSKANVLTPNLGDMVIFTTNFRPAKGSKGYYRVNMKHGVSSVHSGNRHSLGIIFHDALS